MHEINRQPSQQKVIQWSYHSNNMYKRQVNNECIEYVNFLIMIIIGSIHFELCNQQRNHLKGEGKTLYFIINLPVVQSEANSTRLTDGFSWLSNEYLSY
ncbi:conserved protein of unknown function [Xenorhabdus poinarii G6]|uniref:Uncharacterized protein n=1 Tax=Xenorhabdus poinarii G6 TaxID=1354304 RepID=A0A068R0L0_9GAMM|nr:conserved protein of unknown function [Xenorhabdus poinarii G6]